MLFLVLDYSKWNIFQFWTVGWTEIMYFLFLFVYKFSIISYTPFTFCSFLL